MKLRLTILTALCFFALQSFAQAPRWVDFDSRRFLFPEAEYLVGFSWNQYNKKDNTAEVVKILKDEAQTELTSSVRVSIQSTSTLETEQINKEHVQYFKQASTAYSNMDLSGLKFETYVDEKERKAYAIAYVQKRQLEEFYVNELNTQFRELRNKIDYAKSLEANENKSVAYEAYFATSKIILKIEEIHSIMMAIGMRDEKILMVDRFLKDKNEIDIAMTRLRNGTSTNLDDLCYFLIKNIAVQLPKTGLPVAVHPFTFQDTKAASPFSKLMRNNFSTVLAKDTSMKLVNRDYTKTKQNFVLSGTYWEQGNKIKVTAHFKNPRTGDIIASAEDYIAKSWLTNNEISYKPENFNEAQQRMKAFGKTEVISGGLHAEIWTNKGDENLLYTENDTLKLYVRVNKASFIRIIYYLADGSKVLLFDSYFINSDKVNRVIEIPDEFVCAAPFGVESLQLLAQTKAFTPLVTVSQYGYDFIDEDVNSIMVKTRGFKRVKNEDMKAEKTLTITTMKRSQMDLMNVEFD